MRQLIYGVAASLDGFIAGPNGEYDWIVPDSGIDFVGLYSKFDTFLMGRRTYEVASTRGDLLKRAGMRNVVVSTTLNPSERPEITVVQSGVAEAVRALKAETGKNIWLFGGGALFRSLLDMGLVDAMDVSVFPVLLGSGTPLLPEGDRALLKLSGCNALPSGVLMLSYSIAYVPTAMPPRME
jgi:dihydrofolate reductase